jgi:hypothetical protein
MCIACELGYWSMIDAFEAERSASKKKIVPEGDSDFICEAPTEPPKRKRRTRPHRSSDESLP